jgi:CheY-like chemotaxis protein
MERLLLVDDYAEALEAWRLYLEEAGFDVATATDGREAVRAALETRPDLIVMDLELPVMSGIDATRVLRGMRETRAVPIIAATGQPALATPDVAPIFDLVLFKPCDPSQLLCQIRHLLEARDGNPGHDTAGTSEQATTQNR